MTVVAAMDVVIVAALGVQTAAEGENGLWRLGQQQPAKDDYWSSHRPLHKPGEL